MSDTVKLMEQALALQRLRERIRGLTSERDELRLRLRAQPFPVVEDFGALAWEQADVNEWKRFLATPSGQRMQRAANFHEQAVNRDAVLRMANAENNTGFARGWHAATVYFFQTLSANVPPSTDDDSQGSTGAASLAERHAP
jgi:hypothetical protein